MTSLQEIEAAISNLTPQEYKELLDWLGDYTLSQGVDAQLKADLDAGHMDDLIDRAVEEYKAGRTTPL
jgi:hypothetical protein